MTTAPRRAGLYMRISRDQTGEGLGVVRQEEDCRASAKALGWTVTEVYIDNDISATSGKARPAYRQMLADLEAGTIDAILAWHPDRLYRRAVDLTELVEVVQRLHIPVATARSGDVDLTTPTGLLVAEMLAAIAMYEVRHKTERHARSVQQRREDGLKVRTGTRLFGYTDDMHIIDHEAAITRVMAAKIREGGSILGVCRWLRDQGVTATRGADWTPQGLKRYLTNPKLAGYSTLSHLEQNGIDKNGKPKYRRVTEIVAEGKWQPVLDRDTFETVRAMLTARTRPYIPRKALLLGLIFCGKCGHRLITSAGGKKPGVRNYRCPKRPGMNGCGRVSGVAQPIEEYVEAAAQAALNDERTRANITRLRAHPADQIAEATALELRIIELENQLDEPDVPVDALLRGIGRAKDRLAELNTTLAAGTITLPTRGMPWPEDLQRRRGLIDLVVARVTLMPSDPTWGSGKGFDARRVQIDPR